MRLRWLVCGLITQATVAHAQLSPQEARQEAKRICSLELPECDWLATLGSLERQSVTRAMKARGYVIEPHPWGKQIESVEIYNEDVFAEPTPVLSFFNNFHYTTRESATYHELVIHEDEPWDQPRVEESARILRDATYTSVAVTLPVKAKDPGKVALLVVTRDIWSLRLNTNYTFQDSKLTNLSFSLSENNFLGHRNVLAYAFNMDQGEVYTGPLFIDKNVLGQHVSLSARVDDILNRDDLIDRHKLTNEGSDSTIAVSRPLWSLASEWAATATFTHNFAIIRRYRGTSLLTYDDPDTSEVEAIPTKYEYHAWGTSIQATRQLGHDIKHQISLGYSLNSQHPSLLSDFTDDPVLRAAFERDVFPHSEVVSSPFISYTLFTPTYHTVHNVGTYDLVEDFRSGPQIDATIAWALRSLGSDEHFFRPTITGSYTLPWCTDGYVRASAGIQGRRQEGAWIDDNASFTLRAVTPSRWIGRIVAQSILNTRWHDTTNAFIAIGGDPTLRAFDINQFSVPAGSASSRQFSTQIEARTQPVPIWVFRVGATLFYENGFVGPSIGTSQLHQDVGIGVRALIPQTARDLFRFDLPFALDGVNAGHPRFIASFQSAF